jgi:hypothetical protein
MMEKTPKPVDPSTVEPTEEEKAEQEKFAEMAQLLRDANVPEEVIDSVPKWKQRYGGVRVAFLGEGAYIFKRLTWGEMKSVTTTLSNLSKNPNATEAALAMSDLELQLEKAVQYPRITAETSSQFPAGDLETLQQLITEYSGYVKNQPVVEDL